MRGADELLEQLDLVRQGDETWRGSTPSGSGRPNLYGGMVAAQAMRAGNLSAGLGRRPHSIHAYFLSSGRFGEPLCFTVSPVRDGRSFSVRHVEVSQSSRRVMTMIASFQTPEVGDHYELVGADAPEPPEESISQSTGWETGTGGDGPFELVEGRVGPDRRGSLYWSVARYWAKARSPLPEDPGLHACALVAMGDLRSGHAPTIAMASHTPIRMTSLDYSVWFRTAALADRWMLFDIRAGGNGGGRGLTHGLVHAASGQVGSFAMEMLLREERLGATS